MLRNSEAKSIWFLQVASDNERMDRVSGYRVRGEPTEQVGAFISR